MKNIKQIRENFDLITEKEEKESQKLTALVRAGLYDAKKLPALKKALDKSADKMTGQEKRMLINLLDSLIAQVTSDEQVYRKVKQNVHTMNEAKEDYLSKFDPRFKSGFPSDKDIPSVLILKRKAIRVYPDNQKVALYYSQALDKYVTVPFSDIQVGINEETSREQRMRIAAASRNMLSTGRVVPSQKPLSRKISTAAKDMSKAAKNISDVAKRSGKAIAAGVATGNIIKGGIRSAYRKFIHTPRVEKKLQARLARRTLPGPPPPTPAGPNPGPIPENFYHKLNVLREQRNLEEGKVSDFVYNDLDDFTVSSVGKDVAPITGTLRAAERTRRAWKKGEYGSAALNAIDTAFSGASDAALATGILSPVGAAMKGVSAGVKGAIKAGTKGYKAYQTYKAAKAARAAKTASKADDVVDAAKTASKADNAVDAAKAAKAAKADKLSKPSGPKKRGALVTTGKILTKAGRVAAKTAALGANALGAAAGGNDSSYVLSKKADPQFGKSQLFKSGSSFAQAQDSKRATGERTRQAQAKALSMEENQEFVLSKRAEPKTGMLKVRTSSASRRGDPYAARNERYRQAQAKAFMMPESVIAQLKEMVTNDIQESTLAFNEQEININNTVAKKIVLVYESVNSKNKKKMEQMLNESATSFNKVLTFALRQ